MKIVSRFIAAGLLLAACRQARADTLYVSNDLPQFTISEFNSSGSYTTFASTGETGETGLAFGPNGNLYVADQSVAGESGKEVTEFTPGGVGSVFATPGLSSPFDLAFDSAGNLFVTNQTTFGTIEEFNSSGV